MPSRIVSRDYMGSKGPASRAGNVPGRGAKFVCSVAGGVNGSGDSQQCGHGVVRAS